MSLTAMEWTLCLLAVSSLRAVNAGAIKQDVRLSCALTGCHHGGTCVVQGDSSWCKCAKGYSGLDCGIAHKLPRQRDHGVFESRTGLIIGGIVLGVGAIILIFVLSLRIPSVANAYGRLLNKLGIKVYPHDSRVTLETKDIKLDNEYYMHGPGLKELNIGNTRNNYYPYPYGVNRVNGVHTEHNERNNVHYNVDPYRVHKPIPNIPLLPERSVHTRPGNQPVF